MKDEIALYRAAREAHRKAVAHLRQTRTALRLAQADVFSTHADVVAAEAALAEAQR